MRKRRTVTKRGQLAPDQAHLLLSELSVEEEARALTLADVALHSPSAPTPTVAGQRAKTEHRKLMETLEKAAAKVRKLKPAI